MSFQLSSTSRLTTTCEINRVPGSGPFIAEDSSFSHIVATTFMKAAVSVSITFQRHPSEWNRRWHRSSLQLKTLPGVIGKRFEGLVTIPEAIPEGTIMRITLRCDMTRSTRTSPDGREVLVDMVIGTERSRNGQSSLQTETIHKDRHLFTVTPATLESSATLLPISFQIPWDLPSSGKQLSSASAGLSPRTRIYDYCDWLVQIKLEQASDLREVVIEVPTFDLRTEAILKPAPT